MNDNRKSIGDIGENRAAIFLKNAGYVVLDQKFRTKSGEIDIICFKDNTLVFVEVKTRKNNKFSDAREAVTYSKQQKIKAAAQQYISYHNLDDKNIRFDVAEVYHRDTKAEINIIENAFE